MERVSVSEECFHDAHSKLDLLVSSVPEDQFLFKLDKDLHAWPGLSGIDGSNYFTIFDKNSHKNSIDLITQFSHLSLPSEIVDHMNRLEDVDYYCKSGFFSTISKCWIVIENILYIWSITNKQNLIKFDGIMQIILDVCLVDTPEEIFSIKESNIMIISTPNEILCLPFDILSSNTELKDFQINLKKEILCSIEATGIENLIFHSNNRIFAKKFDGEIFEIYFEVKSGYLSNCKLKSRNGNLFTKIFPTFTHLIFGSEESRIEHIFADNERNLLYTISKWNVLKCYYLGDNNPGFKLISTITYQDVFQSIKKLYNKFIVDDLGDYISHAVVLQKFSANISLKIYTSTAVRLYFKFDSNTHTVQLHHVRFPPIYQSLKSFQLAKAVDIDDVSLFFMELTNSSEKNNAGNVFATTDCVFNPQSSFNELHQIFPSSIGSDHHRLWSTLDIGDKQKIILKDNGLLFISVKSKNEIFSRLLMDYGYNSEEMLSFVVMCSPVYSCMMAIELMIASNPNHQSILHFLNLNGKTKSNQASKYQELTSALPNSFDVTISAGTDMKSIPFNSLLSKNTATAILDSDSKSHNNSYSTILTAIFTYTASLMLPIWKKPIFVERNVSLNIGKNNLIMLAYDKEYLEELVVKIKKLQFFLRDYSNIIFKCSPIELQSAMNILILIEITIEVLSLFLIISDNQYPPHEFIPQKFWQQLSGCEFNYFIQKYKTHSALVIESLLTYYLDNNADIEEINELLGQRCPQIYTETDALFSKAAQYLNFAQSNSEEGNKFVQKAMDIYISILPSLNLRHSCFNLLKCRAFREISILCIRKIKQSNNIDTLDKVFEILTETMRFLHSISKNGTIDESLSQNFVGYDKESADTDFKSMIQICLSVDISPLHMKILETLLTLHEFRLIISVNSPYLNGFIHHMINNPENYSGISSQLCLELAWKYFESKSQFFLAAKHLFRTITEENEIKLKQKYEIINKVLLFLKCIKQSEINNEITNFQIIVNNCKTACDVQIAIIQRLLQIHAPQNCIESLESSLYKLEDLLINFVHPYELLDCKLDILAASNSEVPNEVILTVWNQFIRQQVEKYSLYGGNLTIFANTLTKFKMRQRLFPVGID
ncbi:MAG: hypothetical protein MHMPM18_000653 [Marteilia pararefringens]